MLTNLNFLYVILVILILTLIIICILKFISFESTLALLQYYYITEIDITDYTNWNKTDWDKNTLTLAKICNYFESILEFSLLENLKENKQEIAKRLDSITEFIKTYQNGLGIKEQLEAICPECTNDKDRYFSVIEKLNRIKKIPYGNDWEAHAVNVTKLISRYIWFCYKMDEPNIYKPLQYNGAFILLNLIETPIKALGTIYRNANSIFITYPWIMSHYIFNAFEEARLNIDYIDVMEFAKLNIYETTGNGFYKDSTYIQNDIVSFGYFYDMFKTVRNLFIFEFKDNYKKYLNKYLHILQILINPNNLYVGFNCVYHDSLKILIEKPLPEEFKTQYGLKWIPTCRFIRYFTPTYVFSMRGQTDSIGFYKSQPDSDGLAQWIDYRNIIFNDKFDENDRMGMVFNVKNTNFILIRLPTTTSTTTTFNSKFNKSTLTILNGSLDDDTTPKSITLEQETKISQFGDYTRYETVTIDETTEKIKIYIKIVVDWTSEESYKLYLTKSDQRIATKDKFVEATIIHEKGITSIK